jgi:hypothetical protein
VLFRSIFTLPFTEQPERFQLTAVKGISDELELRSAGSGEAKAIEANARFRRLALHVCRSV